jgi:hypothetical protein
MRRKKLHIVYLILLGIAFIWALLTLFVERKGAEKQIVLEQPFAEKTALIVYDPDPFYNLDEQISTSFAKGLNDKSVWSIKISTVASAEKLKDSNFDLYVFCANTYNWAPDKAIRDFIVNHKHLEGANVAAITLGSGATERSQRVLEGVIRQKGANLLGSETYWLMKPNDENRMSESNVYVAVDMARTFGDEIATKMNEKFIPKN